MVIDHCTLIKQAWMILHFNQRVTADAKMYHTRLYIKCTTIYDHICTQFWRSVSAPGHGNAILNKLTRPTRVRSPDPTWNVWFTPKKQKNKKHSCGLCNMWSLKDDLCLSHWNFETEGWPFSHRSFNLSNNDSTKKFHVELTSWQHFKSKALKWLNISKTKCSKLYWDRAVNISIFKSFSMF